MPPALPSADGQVLPATKNLWADVFSSLVVVLVAIPLALGIALASGAPSLLAGLIACAVGGIVVGLIAGAPLQVSGPAAGLTVVVYGFVQEFGWAVTCAITCCSGLMQFFLGVLKIGRICLAISSSVVHGMLAGIGVVIVLSQIHIVLGGGPESSALKNILELPQQLLDLHGAATGIGLFTIGVMLLWQFAPKFLRLLPSALVAIFLATAIASLGSLDVPRVTLPDGLLSAISLPQLPSENKLPLFLLAVITMAIVASVESLLCAVATDKLHTGKRADLDRELLGQGCGNIISGLIGGLPITGVIVRSSANVAAGAKTNLSTILHGVWILVFIVLLAPILERIPLAALAGLLVYVGANLVHPKYIRELRSERQLFVYLVTLLGVVFWSLLGGVLLGVGLSLFLLVLKLARTEIAVTSEDECWRVTIEGALTFLSIPELTKALQTIPAGMHVEIDLLADFVDHAALEAIHTWRISFEKSGGKVDIDEVHHTAVSSSAQQWNPATVQHFSDKVVPRMRFLAPRTRKALVVNFFQGVRRFHKTARVQRSRFEKLGTLGQSPKILFAGCADSRVVPHLITSTRPGEMFTIQNVGNLLPMDPHVAESAALDYALEVLHVEHIMICGHSDCGAMKVLAGDVPTPTSESIQNWVLHAKPTLDFVEHLRQGGQELKLDPRLSLSDQIAQANVVRQIQLLTQYPLVKQRIAEGNLNIWGLFFNIREAKLLYYEKESSEFVHADSFLSAHALHSVKAAQKLQNHVSSERS